MNSTQERAPSIRNQHPLQHLRVEFTLTSWVLTPAKWNDVESTPGAWRALATRSQATKLPLSLYALMDDGTGGQSWTLMADDGVDDELNMPASRTQAFYWDIGQGVVGTDVS